VPHVNEQIMEHLPIGVIRQSDFFGETITFVKDVDEKSLSSVDHSTLIQSKNQFNQKNDNNDNSQPEPPKSTQADDSISEATSSFDGMSLCILSRGSANLHTGNDSDGPEARAFHASALAWSEILRHASDWNCNNEHGSVKSITTAPMLTVAAVAPVVAQGGSHYLRRIDRLLDATRDSATATPQSLWAIANNAVSFRDAVLSTTPESSGNNSDSEPIQHLLTPRERWHMHALHQLLQNNHRDAMGAYLRLLELFPGDLLGLSLALDVAYALGDANSALRAATNVSTYWTERDGGALRFQQSHPAQNLANSLISVGLSSSSGSSRASTAERLAETAIARDSDGTGGTSVWALSHCLASEGRSSEMVSKLATTDGAQFYEACGYLHFHTRMKGYGGIALLDCRRAGAGRSALRLYDGGFGRDIEYSGNNVEGLERGGEEVCLREMRVPTSVRSDVADAVGTMFSGWFGGSGKSAGDGASQKGQPLNDSDGAGQGLIDQKKQRPKKRTMEDVLCWLPPNPLLLTHGTALLLRLTLCDAIPESDDRWADLRAAWTVALRSDNGSDDSVGNQTPVEFMPMAMIASSLVMEPDKLHLNAVSQPLQIAMQGFHKMGKLMKLGQLKMAPLSSQKSDTSHVEEWREVLYLIARARDSCERWEMPTGMSSSTYLLADAGDNSSSAPAHPIGWDFDMRQFLEYSLCHAAMQVGDYESLCLARAICSEGTTLRSNCAELWWRYGQVLDMLGDDVAAENARAASVSLGSGEGGASF